MECPELGGEGDANVEEVMEGVMYPLLILSRPPSEEGGSGDASRATLLTRLSISPALSSVLSFSSCISLKAERREILLAQICFINLLDRIK